MVPDSRSSTGHEKLSQTGLLLSWDASVCAGLELESRICIYIDIGLRRTQNEASAISKPVPISRGLLRVMTRPAPWVGSGGFQKLAGRAGPGRVGSGRVRRCSNPHGAGRVGSGGLRFFFFFFFFRTHLLSSFWTSRGHGCRPFSPPVLAFNFYRA